ncbi:MAG: hypothetical protein JOZ72_09025 [Alphaproteobacteria bacterium]|nr:hypothetical protein [Alphaproteobacteria bacterium]
MDRERELKERAQELRAVATFMRLPAQRASMLGMAEIYERLAEEPLEEGLKSASSGD